MSEPTSAQTSHQQPLMIAHAGGGYDGQNYTNSLEALNKSYQAGFRYMEIDFSWTADEKMVCLHDWGKTFKKLFGFKTKFALTYKEFIDASKKLDFQICDLQLLADWLKDKPDVKVITDIKHHNLKGLKIIVDQYPSLIPQFIPQFYQPEEYSIVKSMGYDQLIWILYQYKGSKKSVVELSKHMDLLAVSMRARQAQKRSLQKLLKQHRIFVYTINDLKKIQRLVCQYQVSGIYTDFMPSNPQLFNQ